MPIDTAKTGAAIAAHRQHLKLSQQGLAGLMNVTHQAVSKWEKGLALPDTETLLALSKLFNASMEDLLTGVLPKAPEHAASATLSEEEEPAAAIPASDIASLDFSAIMNLLPFVSTHVAEQLFQNYASANAPDAGKLTAIAPFISTQALNDYVIAHPLTDASPEVTACLAPFLPTQTVDQMILNMNEPIPSHIIHMLLPFASAKVVDQMVLGKLSTTVKASPKRESPRTRLIRKAIETADAELLNHFCENAGELNPNDQFELVQHLVEHRQYHELAEVLEEVDEDVQHHLLDRALEINDPQLLHLLSEHLDG